LTDRALALMLAAGIGGAFILMARSDLRTSRVVVHHSRTTTTAALVGMGALAVISGAWTSLLQAAAGAVVVTGIQLIPYLLQRRRGGGWIGRADVRLAVPFGWTLGWFGLDLVFLGYAIALVSGLAFSFVTRQRRIPFVPFLTIGLWSALTWTLIAGP
jgi:prepilin signal peptidase PulO-like enzyme (type II secretory pathway)